MDTVCNLLISICHNNKEDLRTTHSQLKCKFWEIPLIQIPAASYNFQKDYSSINSDNDIRTNEISHAGFLILESVKYMFNVSGVIFEENHSFNGNKSGRNKVEEKLFF
jgi:hypothetical protein